MDNELQDIESFYGTARAKKKRYGNTVNLSLAFSIISSIIIFGYQTYHGAFRLDFNNIPLLAFVSAFLFVMVWFFWISIIGVLVLGLSRVSRRVKHDFDISSLSDYEDIVYLLISSKIQLAAAIKSKESLDLERNLEDAHDDLKECISLIKKYREENLKSELTKVENGGLKKLQETIEQKILPHIRAKSYQVKNCEIILKFLESAAAKLVNNKVDFEESLISSLPEITKERSLLEKIKEGARHSLGFLLFLLKNKVIEYIIPFGTATGIGFATHSFYAWEIPQAFSLWFALIQFIPRVQNKLIDEYEKYRIGKPTNKISQQSKPSNPQI